MLRQRARFGNMGQSDTMLIGGLFQSKNADPWGREKGYWQKFTEGGRYFNDIGMSILAAASPAGLFFQYLQGLEKKRQQPTETERPTQGVNGLRHSSANMGATEPILIVQQAAATDNHPALFRKKMAKIAPTEKMADHRLNSVAPTENTVINQSYLSQQINQYLHRTQLFKQENHLHTTKLKMVSGDKEKRDFADISLPSGGEKPSVTAKGTGQPISVEVGNEMPFLNNDGIQGENVSLFSSPYPVAADLSAAVGMDWSEILSMLQKNMAEAFTELLQNMIPETEGR